MLQIIWLDKANIGVYIKRVSRVTKDSLSQVIIRHRRYCVARGKVNVIVFHTKQMVFQVQHAGTDTRTLFYVISLDRSDEVLDSGNISTVTRGQEPKRNVVIIVKHSCPSLHRIH